MNTLYTDAFGTQTSNIFWKQLRLEQMCVHMHVRVSMYKLCDEWETGKLKRPEACLHLLTLLGWGCGPPSQYKVFIEINRNHPVAKT